MTFVILSGAFLITNFFHVALLTFDFVNNMRTLILMLLRRVLSMDYTV